MLVWGQFLIYRAVWEIIQRIAPTQLSIRIPKSYCSYPAAVGSASGTEALLGLQEMRLSRGYEHPHLPRPYSDRCCHGTQITSWEERPSYDLVMGYRQHSGTRTLSRDLDTVTGQRTGYILCSRVGQVTYPKPRLFAKATCHVIWCAG